MEIVRQGSTFDVCVIGSGPAGGFMAKELTEAGAKVLLLEAGAEVITIKELLGHASIESSERYAKLSNQRVKHVYQQTIRKVIAKTRV